MAKENASPDDLKKFNASIEGDFKRIEEKAEQRIRKLPAVPDVLYHYTNMLGLCGIIDSQRFWATDIRYLNDSKEMSHCRQLFSIEIDALATKNANETEFKQRLSKTFDVREHLVPFVACFSESADDLNQWRGYAGGVGGAAIGVKLKQLPERMIAAKINYEEDAQKQEIKALAREVFDLFRALSPKYEEKYQTHLMAKCCKLLRSASAPLLICSKSRHWRTEQEWRLVGGMTDRHENVKYRPGHFGLIPYVELAPHPRAGVFANRLAIEQVVLGPHREQELAAEAMRAYLGSKGYSMAKVCVSDVPLRF